MAWLPDGEKISKISLFVLAQLTNVTDRRTDGRTDTACRHMPRLCIASRGKNVLTKTKRSINKHSEPILNAIVNAGKPQM